MVEKRPKEVERKCEVCKIKFFTYIYPTKSGRFCSRKCMAKWQHTLIGANSRRWKGGFRNKKCIQCGTIYKVYLSRFIDETNRFCSRKCHNDWRSINTREKNSPSWKGDNVGYHGVHIWVRNKLGLAKFHQCSQKDNTCSKRLEWSNISGKYLRKLSDWQILCKSHHTRFDMTDEWRENCRKASKKHMADPKVIENLRNKLRTRTNLTCHWIKCKKTFYPKTNTQRFCSKLCGIFNRYNYV